MTEFFSENISLVLFFPLWLCMVLIISFYLNMLQSKKTTLILSLIATSVPFIFASFFVYKIISGQPLNVSIGYDWLTLPNLSIGFGFYLDKVSVLALFLFCLISLFVQIYSYGYLHDDNRINRMFMYLSFVNFTVIGFITSSNLVQMSMFLSLISVSTYMLMNYGSEREKLSAAKRKLNPLLPFLTVKDQYRSNYVFLWNFAADLVFFVTVIIFLYFNLNYGEFTSDALLSISSMPVIADSLYAMSLDGTYLIVCLLVLFTIFVKTAQFPFSSWLVKSSYTNIPAYAIINNTTITLCGVLLLFKLQPIWILSDKAIFLLGMVGAISMVLCAIFAFYQSDIKKLFAHSTSSALGLGLLFTALGFYDPAITNFSMHIVAKTILILIIGVFIYKFDESINQTKTVPGFAHKRLYAIAYFVSLISLSGFFIRNVLCNSAILSRLYEIGQFWLIAAIVTYIAVTVSYLLRTYFILFENNEISANKSELKDKQSSKMLFPILSLMVILLIIGYFPINFWVQLNIPGFFAAFFVPLATLLGAFIILNFTKFKIHTNSLWAKFLTNEMYIENVFKTIVGVPFNWIAKLIGFVEKYLVEALARVVTFLLDLKASIANSKQTGNFSDYLLYGLFVLSAALLSFFVLYILIVRGF